MPSFLDDFAGFLELGAWTSRHVRPLFDLFRDENVAPALALIIFGSALIFCVAFLLDSTLIRIRVWRRVKFVRRIKDRVSFAEQLPEIDKLMLGYKYLRHSWQEFRETLIEPEPNSENPRVVLNTDRPQNYFNTAEAGLRFPLYRAMPNLFVGIGLLLTFFGLVTALFFTTAAIRGAADLTASQNALRDLLYAASFKFYTSIAGLAGSIVLTLVIRYGVSAIERSFDHLASALEAKLVFVTPVSIAFSQYREAREQTRNLKLFNTEIAISVGKRIEEALAATLPAYLAQAMAPIGKSLDEVANKLTSMNEGAIGEMAGNFANKLQGATGDHLQGLAGTLSELRTSLEEMNRNMKESGATMVASVSQSAQEMRTIVETMTSSLDNAAARMSTSSESAGTRFSSELAAASDAFEQASTRLTANIEETINSISRELSSKSASIGEQVAEAAIKAGEDSRVKIVDAGDDLTKTFSDIGNRLADAVARMERCFVGTVDEMSKIEGAIDRHVQSLSQLTKAAQQTEGAMSSSAKSIVEAGHPIAEGSRLIAVASQRILDATTGSERSISGAQTEIRNISELLQATLRTTTEQWESYERRFKDVDDSLGVVLDRIIRSVQENLEALRGFVEKVDEKLSGAVDRLGGGIDELGEFAQSMEHLTANLSTARNLNPDSAVRG
ncbi:anti-phage ZorAB system protein ZorA [Bradyrhizobium sp. CB82]|uniref:anti-phage ZorAB system protein ZorA n=1 Tax=Bradyrhizobium sp. CB82 TaxID=3039159 RepID=UPI0024B0D443|nr:anti-phage ZorAB system protein ZorA [Bradyrhizobium sp. CB82]WFU42745.1 anti-phage ZorAB system protein ZorA [Bradyrhizobium sp. CB82]